VISFGIYRSQSTCIRSARVLLPRHRDGLKPIRLFDQFDLARAPALVEERLEWAVEANDREPRAIICFGVFRRKTLVPTIWSAATLLRSRNTVTSTTVFGHRLLRTRLVSAAIIQSNVQPVERGLFRKEARRRRGGYQTLINEVLARHVGKDVA
jgi:hypothetical protein